MSPISKTLLITLTFLTFFSFSNSQSSKFKCPAGYIKKNLNEFKGYGSANTTTNTISSSKNLEGIFTHLELFETEKYSDLYYVIQTTLTEVTSQEATTPASNIVDGVNFRVHEKFIDFSSSNLSVESSKKNYLSETLTLEYDTLKNDDLNDISDYTLSVINCLGKTTCDKSNQVSQVPTKFKIDPNDDTKIDLLVNLNYDDGFVSFYVSGSDNKIVYKLSDEDKKRISNHYISISTYFKGTRALTLTDGVACFNPRQEKKDVELNVKKSFCWPASIDNIIGKKYKGLQSSIYDCTLLSTENSILGLKDIENLLLRKRILIKFTKNGEVFSKNYRLTYDFEGDNIRFSIEYSDLTRIKREYVNYSFSKKVLTLIIDLE